MTTMIERQQLRKNEYKRGVDEKFMRRKREENQLKIGREKREEKLAKKRKTRISDRMTNPVTKYETDSKDPNVVLKSHLYSKDPNVVLKSLKYIRHRLSRDEDLKSAIDSTLKIGIVPKLIEYLSYVDYPKHQYETAWALTNLTAGTKEQTENVIKQGPIISYLINASKFTNDPSLQTQLAWCMAHIASDKKSNAKNIVNMGGIDVLLRNIKTNLNSSKRDIDLIENSMWALSAILEYNPPSNIGEKCLPVISELLAKCSNLDILKETMKCVRNISDTFSNDEYQLLITTGIVNNRFLTFLNSDEKTSMNCLRTIGNIITGPDILTDKILGMGFLSYARKFIDKEVYRKEICWIISNIAAGTKEQVKIIMNSNLISDVMRVLNDSVYMVKKECLYILYNLLSHPETIDCLAYRSISIMYDNVPIWNKSADLTIATLETIKQIIKANRHLDLIKNIGLLDVIDDMWLNTDNEKITDLCEKIMKFYTNSSMF